MFALGDQLGLRHRDGFLESEKGQEHLVVHQMLADLIKLLHLAVNAVIELIERHGCEIQVDSTVQEDDAADFCYGRALAQPFSVHTGGSKRFALLDES